MPKSILIIGAGSGQLPAIKCAQDIGLEVIVIDKNPKAIGMEIADYAYNIDVIDFSKALDVAKTHKVSGVITMQSDLPVPTVGFINNNLGLTGVTLEVANLCSNKIETRRRLAVYDCDQPKFQVVDSLEDAINAVLEIKLPCVIKAPDGSGSRGVVKVNSENEIESAFFEALKFSRNKKVLVEEFISGLEFGAQTFSEGGVCKVVLLHNDTISEPPFMIPIGHSFPFKYLTEKERLKAESAIMRAIQALGIQNGPTNVDLILDEETNTVKIIEVGARIGATCLPELVYHHTGIDWVEAAIKNAIGERCDLAFKKNIAVAAMIVEAPKDGKYLGYSLDYKPEDLSVIEFEVTPERGSDIQKLRMGTDRIGKVIAVGKSVEEAEKNARLFKDGIKIQVSE